MEEAKIPMNKVYLKHCKGVVWTGLLTIFIACLLAAFYLLPVFAYFPNNGKRVDVSGFQYICYALRIIFKGLYNPELERFDSSVSNYGGLNPMFTFISSSHSLIEFVITVLLVLSTVFAIIIFIRGLIFLFRGHAKRIVMISALSHSVASCLGFFVGVLFLYLLLCRKMFVECNILDHVRFYITPFVIILLMTTFAIILSVIYTKSFKKRVYIKDYKPKPKDDPEKCSELIRKYIENFPKGTTQIGEYAFDGNDEITEAIIPEGITLIAQNAFSNCPNLKTVNIPATVTELGTDCFFNTPRLETFIFRGTTYQWKQVYKGTAWNDHSSLEIVETSEEKIFLKGERPEPAPEAEQSVEEPKEEVKEEAPKTP